MELRHFRYFVAVADAGGFVKAAQKLNVAQPALSRQIRDMERELGVSLFERHRRGVKVTRDGQRFLGDARRLIDQADRVVARARDGRRTEVGSFSIGYGELAAYWPKVSEMLHQFRLANPQVVLQVSETRRQDMRTGLRDERMDVGIIGMVEWPPRGFDGIRLLQATQTGVLIAASHPLASRAAVRYADLQSLRWFHLPAEVTWDAYSCARTLMRRAGVIQMRQGVRAPGFAFLPQITAGTGWAFADEAMAATISAIVPGIVYRPLADARPELWIVAIWKRDADSDELRSFRRIATALTARA